MTKLIYPYNFVPLSEKKRKYSVPDTEDMLSGYIEYELTTKTPLFIPNTSAYSKQKTEGHKTYHFFSYEDLSACEPEKAEAPANPIIPGSEIRGAIRSIYESMTDSCLSQIKLDQTLTKRTYENYKPAILKYSKEGNTLLLYAAKDLLYREGDDGNKNWNQIDFRINSFETLKVQDGSAVSFSYVQKPDREKAKPIVTDVKKTQKEKGYLIKGNAGPQLSYNDRASKCDNCPEIVKSKCDAKYGKGKPTDDCYKLEKHCAHIFVIKKNRQGNDIVVYSQEFSSEKDKEANTLIENLRKVLDIYQKVQQSDRACSQVPYKEYSESFKKFQSALGNSDCAIPVYYSVIKEENKEENAEKYYLSPACITREVYYQTLQNMIKDFSPCSDIHDLCPACALFGMVNHGAGVTSRLRFTDLALEEQGKDTSIYEDMVVLPELSSPRITSTELYLKKPEANQLLNWTYDYYVNLNGDVPVAHFYNAEIAGRKFYWHSLYAYQKLVKERQPGKCTSSFGEIEVNDRNVTVRPIRSGIRFSGRVYFSNVMESELKRLIDLLDVSSIDNGKYGIKIGHGKTVGLGSVELHVKHVIHHTYQLGKSGVETVSEPCDITPNIKKDFSNQEPLRYLDFNALAEDEITSYAGVDTETKEGFQWFVDNRTAYKMDRHTNEINLRQIEKGPRSRLQVKYEQAMMPYTKLHVNNRDASAANRRTNYNSYQKPAIGTIYPGKVSSVSDNAIFVEVDGLRPPRVHMSKLRKRCKYKEVGQHYSEGDTVYLQYNGKEEGNDGREHDSWVEVAAPNSIHN